MAIDQTVDNFKDVANMGTAVTLLAMLAGFLAAEVARALIEPRQNLPDEAYGIVVVVLSAAYGAYGGPRWRSLALGAGFNSVDALANRLGIQARIMEAV